jgi:hypothetical protein
LVPSWKCMQVHVLEERANVWPYPESKSAPSEESSQSIPGILKCIVNYDNDNETSAFSEHKVHPSWKRMQVRVLEEHANVRPYPESKSAPSEEHPGDSRPRKYYFLCLTKRTPQVRCHDPTLTSIS